MAVGESMFMRPGLYPVPGESCGIKMATALDAHGNEWTAEHGDMFPVRVAVLFRNSILRDSK